MDLGGAAVALPSAAAWSVAERGAGAHPGEVIGFAPRCADD